MSEKLQEIIDQIKSGALALTDIQTLAAAIQSGDETLVAGQQAVAIGGSATESIILTGSNNYVSHVHQGLNLAEFKDFLKLLQPIENMSPSSTAPVVEDGHLGKIILDVRSVDLINSRLEVLDELQQSKHLSPTQADKFNKLSQKIQSINSSSWELKEIETIAEKLLEQAFEVLAGKIRDLKQKSDSELEELRLSRHDIECQENCLEKQLQLLRIFKANLEWVCKIVCVKGQNKI